MVHVRNRFVDHHIRESLRFSPLTGVLGQRQVGKTTTVESITAGDYVTFDDDAVRSSAELAPQAFLDQFHKLCAIDECQKVPGIFPALKLRVQKSKRPGQFILTGSVRFTSRKAIQESLTGRIYTVEMLPLTFSEMNREPLHDFSQWSQLSDQQLAKQINDRLPWSTDSKLTNYISHGGLPGICFLRKSIHRSAKFKSHIETLLQRDLRLVTETSIPYNRLLLLLRYIAHHQGAPLVVKDASRATNISQATVNRLIASFEALFLIRRMSGSGDRKGDQFYFEDQGMASYLASEQAVSKEQRFAFSQLFASAHYAQMNDFTLSYFETKGGAHVPFVFEFRDHCIGFIMNPSEAISQSSMRAAMALLDRKENGSTTIYFLSKGTQVVRIGERMMRVPLLGIV